MRTDMMDEFTEDYRCPFTDHICHNAWDCASCDVTAEIREWEKEQMEGEEVNE